jgi:uncharacterized protein (TIGR03435 family)
MVQACFDRICRYPVPMMCVVISCMAAGALPVGFMSSTQVEAQQAAAAPAAERPSFEVAAIKPGKPGDGNHDWDSNSDRITIENYSLRDLIVAAYGLKSTSQVLGGPQWIDKEHFDIAAKLDDAEVAKVKGMPRAERAKEWQLMLQSLLAERFHLKATQGERKLPVLALVVDKSGAKLKQSTPAEQNSSHLSSHNGDLTAAGVSMDSFAEFLGRLPESGDRIVVDRTGLAGKYDFAMKWNWNEGDEAAQDTSDPGLFTGLQEQLGLKLKPSNAPAPVVIVETASEPAYD